MIVIDYPVYFLSLALWKNFETSKSCTSQVSWWELPLKGLIGSLPCPLAYLAKQNVSFGSLNMLFTFSPFTRCETQATSVIGHNMVGPHRNEYLYAGCGVFVGSANIFRKHHLYYEGVRYKFEYYSSEHDSLRGVLHLYYVEELQHLGTPIGFYPGTFAERVAAEFFDTSTAMLTPTRYVGEDSGYYGLGPREAAALAGLSKWKLPKHRKFGQPKFRNEVITVNIRGFEYPAIATYHANHDPKRSASVGSVRMYSVATFNIKFKRG